MARKDVEEYYQRMTSDYVEMKRVLKELENIPQENIKKANANIDNIRDQVKALEVNYKRLSYIMYLLNMPNKKEKKSRYEKSESKRLDTIGKEHTNKAVIKENKEVIDFLKENF